MPTESALRLQEIWLRAAVAGECGHRRADGGKTEDAERDPFRGREDFLKIFLTLCVLRLVYIRAYGSAFSYKLNRYRDMIYGGRMICLLRKHDIISVHPCAAVIYHRAKAR